MLSNIAWAMVFVFVSGTLFGCVQTSIPPKTDLKDTPGSPIMKYRWQSDYARVIEVPSDISGVANNECIERGFDKSFMLSISTEGPLTSAVFSCRGSDL